MMDDIDRLSSEEICMVFKLVTLTASFPHLTYVLAYDLDMVTNSLASVQGIDGAL